MARKIDRAAAEAILREEAHAVVIGEPIDVRWQKHVERLSTHCEAPGSSRTHIAFLGTVMLAKAVDPRVDLCAIKPDHDRKNENAFSARSLSTECWSRYPRSWISVWGLPGANP